MKGDFYILKFREIIHTNVVFSIIYILLPLMAMAWKTEK